MVRQVCGLAQQAELKQTYLLYDDDVVAPIARCHASQHEETQVVDVLCMRGALP